MEKTEGAVCINPITQTVKSAGFKTRNNEFIQTTPSVFVKKYRHPLLFPTKNIDNPLCYFFYSFVSVSL